jgi:hypothetical protein
MALGNSWNEIAFTQVPIAIDSDSVYVMVYDEAKYFVAKVCKLQLPPRLCNGSKKKSTTYCQCRRFEKT